LCIELKSSTRSDAAEWSSSFQVLALRKHDRHDTRLESDCCRR
jgi:hypothetical protein